MSSHVLPDLPPSVGTTVAVLAGLGLVLNYAAQLPSARVANAADEVRLKGKRLVAELESMQASLTTGRALLEEGPPKMPLHTAAEVTEYVERLAEEVARLAKANARVRQAAEMLVKAAKDAQPFAQVLERMLPGWGAAIGKVEPAAAELTRELRAVDFEAVVHSIAPQLQAMFALSMTEQGLAEWVARLPVEEEPLVNEDDGEPVLWTLDHGWAGAK